MIRKLVCTLVFSALAAWGLKAQSLEETYVMAQSLQAQGQYEAAIAAYERVLFFDTQQQFQGASYRKLAICAEALGQFKQADRYLNFAYYLQTEPALQREIQFQQIRVRLLRQDFVSAQEELWLLGALSSGERGTYHLYGFVAAFGMGAYDSAQYHIDFFVGENDSLGAVVADLFAQNDKVSKISARKAKILSIILPGLGQFYAGEVKAGINSLGLTAGILILGIQVAIRSSALDAIFSIVPWFTRYYQGGYLRAADLAIRKRERRRAEIYQELLGVIGE
ncbi:MAG: hypothetical protein AAFN10_17020 [Bacteroidota bacterium]